MELVRYLALNMFTLGTYVVANVESLVDPVLGDTTKSGFKAVDVLGRSTAIGVDVAGKTGTVFRVANEENTLDGVKAGACQLGHGIHSGGSTLRVSFQDETHVGVGPQGSGDVVDDLCMSARARQISSDPLLTSVVPALESWLAPAA